MRSDHWEPVAEVVEQDWLSQGVGFGEEGVLSDGHEEAAVSVAGEVVGEGEDVLGSLGGFGEEDHAERGAGSGATGLAPAG